MRSFKAILSVGVFVLVSSVPAVAIPMSGSLGFTGLFGSNSTAGINGSDWTGATQFGFTEALWKPSTSGIFPNPNDSYSPVSAVNEQLSLSADCFASFLQYNNGIQAVSFDITSIDVTLSGNSFLAQGSGIFYMTGCDPTLATWEIDAKPFSQYVYGLYWGEASFTASGVAVADFGSTAGMLGIPLVILFWMQRRRMAA